MRLRDDFVAVKVPATSANLGPGFDSMGLALDLWDEVSVHATTGATSVVVEGEGAGNVEQGEDNLVVRALRLALDRVGAPQVGVRMHCTNRIPHSRGLGSSASAIVAGVTLARALIGDADVLGRQEILEIGSQMEGHPDNVAPAVFGGATVSWMNEETSEVGSVRLTPPDGISPVAFIPDFELRTAAARAALPATVPHGDASFNVARGALLAAVLSGNAQASGGADLHALLMEATRPPASGAASGHDGTLPRPRRLAARRGLCRRRLRRGPDGSLPGVGRRRYSPGCSSCRVASRPDGGGPTGCADHPRKPL